MRRRPDVGTFGCDIRLWGSDVDCRCFDGDLETPETVKRARAPLYPDDVTL